MKFSTSTSAAHHLTNEREPLRLSKIYRDASLVAVGTEKVCAHAMMERTPRLISPSGKGSILTISAPRSARIMEQNGLDNASVRSITRKPSSEERGIDAEDEHELKELAQKYDVIRL